MEDVRTRRLDTVEVAKICRKRLKGAFPAVKFSVRSERYAGGSSIDVSWTDGPTETQVRDLLNPLQGSDFDGMQDMKIYRGDQLLANEDGSVEVVSYGVDFILGHRSLSAAALRKLAVEVAEFAGLDAPLEVRDNDGYAYVEGGNERLPVRHYSDFGKAGAGLASDTHESGGDWHSNIVTMLGRNRDMSKRCDHERGTYPCGDGWHRCLGCGMKTRTRREET